MCNRGGEGQSQGNRDGGEVVLLPNILQSYTIRICYYYS